MASVLDTAGARRERHKNSLTIVFSLLKTRLPSLVLLSLLLFLLPLPSLPILDESSFKVPWRHKSGDA